MVAAGVETALVMYVVDSPVEASVRCKPMYEVPSQWWMLTLQTARHSVTWCEV